MPRLAAEDQGHLCASTRLSLCGLESAAWNVSLPGRSAVEPDDEHLVGEAAEDLAAIGDAVELVPDRSDGLVQVELAAVVLDPLVAGEAQLEVDERLIGQLAERDAHELLPGQGLGLALLALEEEAADLGQELHGSLVGVVVRLAGPDGVLVDLESLLGRPAEDHRAEPAVADRQRLVPAHGGRVVAQGQRCVVAPTRGARSGAEHGKKGDRQGESEVRHGGEPV